MTTTITTPSGDGYLNASEITQPLTISGTTELGNKTEVTVTLATNITQTYKIPNGSTTTWTVTFTADQLKGLTDGTYTVQVQAVEDAPKSPKTETATANLTVLTKPDPVTGVYITGFDATTGEATFEVRGLDAGSTTTVTFKQTGKSDVTLSNLGPAGADGKISGKVTLSGWSNDDITAHLAVKDVAQNNWSYDFPPTMENDVVICFYPGTLIRTLDGEVAVETLKIGDLVLTAEGKAMPVRWIGRQ
ncbi:MAG: Hint domain-containing protein, partial [Acetobacteraceae bacterium]|nr:Hint domain-containing protein [Acetobacteraceae bacterium]